MKTFEEQKHYRNLRRKMTSKCDALNVKWALYYANLLSIGGQNPEVVLRNFFNDDMKRFNAEQMSIIYNDLEEVENIKPFTQADVQKEVLELMTKLGKFTSEIEKHFDKDNKVDLKELLPLIPIIRDLDSTTTLLNQRAEETKANL